jgi:hypothetical protein
MLRNVWIGLLVPGGQKIRTPWLLIAEEWLRLAVELDAAKQQSGTSLQR